MFRTALVACFLLGLTACSSTGTMPDSNESAKAKPAASMSKAADIRSEVITYNAGGATLTGYMAWDANIEAKRPGVLVVHEWWGHNDYVRQRARQLAEMGYTAFALDMYGDGKQASHPGDAKKFMMEVFNNMDAGTARFVAAMNLLKAHPTVAADDIAAIGYCFGGAVVLNMARFGFALDGVASFHGNLSTQSPAKPGRVKAKVLVLHGADDPFVPAEQVETFKQEMAAANVDMEFHAYPGAKHSFTSKAADEYGKKFDLPLAYDAEADQQSWAELDQFLTELFGPRM